MTDLEIRETQLRVDQLEERTITGIAVPYGEAANIGGQYLERFQRGAIDSIEDVKLFYAHEEPIGKVISGRETDAGYEITARVSDTPRGNEVLTLMRDGVLNKFSVGFIPLESERDGQTVTRTKISLRETSVVAFPAYSGAEIQQVREESETPIEPIIEQESDNMSENIEMDVRSVQDEVAELRRVVESGLTINTPAVSTPAFRSQGEFAKALVKGDAAAIDLARAASTSADAALQTPFIGYIDTLINNSRPTLSAFSRAALPATGLSVEYAKIDSNTLAVGVQDPENEALSFGNLTFESVTASVVTYGGYTSMSRQYIERSSISTVDQVFRGLSIAYANATNAAVVSVLAGLDFTGKTFDADGGTAASLISGVANGASYIFQNTGLSPEFILAAPDAYVNIVTVAGSDGRPVVAMNGDGSNTIGSAAPAGLRGSLLGLPIVVDPALASGTVYLANSAALETLESSGSPVRLTDGDITTLTDSVSVYGYMAVTTPRVGAIVKLDVTA